MRCQRASGHGAVVGGGGVVLCSGLVDAEAVAAGKEREFRFAVGIGHRRFVHVSRSIERVDIEPCFRGSGRGAHRDCDRLGHLIAHGIAAGRRAMILRVSEELCAVLVNAEAIVARQQCEGCLPTRVGDGALVDVGE